MSTEQNYGGKGRYANPTSQTVKSDHKASVTTADRQQLSENLNWYKNQKIKTVSEILNQISGFNGIDRGDDGAVGSLSRIVEHWITTQYKRIARTTNEEDMDFWDGHVRNVMDTIAHIAYLDSQLSYLRKLNNTIDQFDQTLSTR